MNVALLKKIKARILAKPDKFRMDVWTCGTAHCIGGWACVLSGRKLKPWGLGRLADGGFVEPVAMRLLRIARHDDAMRLFGQHSWPIQFQFRKKDSRKRKAERAAARIDHFIATGGAE